MKRLMALPYWLWKVLPLSGRVKYALLWVLNTKYLVGVTAVVFDDAERVLLVRHTYRNRYPWGLPGGWAHGHEQFAETAARELLEETGLRVTVVGLFQVRNDPRWPTVDVIYLCRHLDGVFQPNAEISALRFCALDDLPAGLLPSQRALLPVALAAWRARQGNPARPPATPA